MDIAILVANNWENVCKGVEGMDVKVVYTVSSKGTMIRDIINSLQSLRRFVGRSDIIVFYTPPRNELDYEEMAKFAVVKEVENLTEPFAVVKKLGPSRYGEKVHLCDVDSPNVIFLDADTIVRKDVTKLVDGDFDFSARIGIANMDFNLKYGRPCLRKWVKNLFLCQTLDL